MLLYNCPKEIRTIAQMGERRQNGRDDQGGNAEILN